MMYTPDFLPALPREYCPYRIHSIYHENGERVRSLSCLQPTGEYGWCQQHEYVLNFLIAGQVLNWPEVKIMTPHEEERIIKQGKRNWEQDAIRLHTDLTWLRDGQVQHRNLYEEIMATIWPLVKADETARTLYLDLRAQVVRANAA